MKLSQDTWHARNWRCWLKRSRSNTARRYKDRYDYDDFGEYVLIEGRPADLCTYTRVAILWGPLKRFGAWGDEHPDLATVTCLVLGILFLGTLANVFILGITAWWHPYAVIVGGMLTAGLGLFIIFGLIELFTEKVGPKIRELEQDREQRKFEKKEPNIFIERIKAHKQKICPIIEFEDSK